MCEQIQSPLELVVEEEEEGNEFESQVAFQERGVRQFGSREVVQLQKPFPDSLVQRGHVQARGRSGHCFVFGVGATGAAAAAAANRSCFTL